MPHHLVGIAVAMTLLIGFVHHIDAPAVAELVDIFSVRIVGRAKEVHICLFHQADVLLVSGVIHISSGQRMMVVAVDSPQLHVLSIDFEHLTYTLHALDAKVIVDMFYFPTLLILQRNAERIEVRFLSRPQARMVQPVMDSHIHCISWSDGWHSLCESLAINTEIHIHLP